MSRKQLLLSFSMLGVLAIIYVVIMVPVEYFIKRPIDVTVKTRYIFDYLLDVLFWYFS